MKKRWHDVATADVKAIDVGDDWYHVAQDQKVQRVVCRHGLSALVDQNC